MIGILGYRRDWEILSNRESGDGFSDILIETTEPENEIGVVIELNIVAMKRTLIQTAVERYSKSRIKTMCRSCVTKGYRKS